MFFFGVVAYFFLNSGLLKYETFLAGSLFIILAVSLRKPFLRDGGLGGGKSGEVVVGLSCFLCLWQIVSTARVC